MAFALGLGLALTMHALPAAAQGMGLSFAGLQNVRGLPVEIKADNLQVNNQTGETVFTGDAVLGQGDMRLAAPQIRIIYAAAGDGSIERLEASGGVTLVTADEAAEAQSAVYEVAAGTVRMTGSVLLTQGRNVLSGDSLFVDLRTEQGRMEGQVRTLIQTAP
ncbi:LptA/OstA family protein [Roseinatronobacter alkalisoli]|uniref:LptA/OstA family protein n=1 Tax=Roseinatronobacter alkalisoli TaxID=3028235 RepID=A0ABT5T657_9RHOB|nr:LptA/OstA family protein [Roseinatronobacter sp. HJB301]MDD7970461.1 LptA/OstA family protein [Roseinatronobacter sp. HJB301]